MPQLIDKGFQVAFWIAHRLMRVGWLLRRPRTHGALVAVWHAGEVLIVKNSYRVQYTFPGGSVKSNESELEAGARELLEEVNLACSPQQLHRVYEGEFPFEFRRDALVIMELTVAARPTLRVDNREVVWAGFLTPAAALELPLAPHLRDYFERRAVAALAGA